MRGGKGIDTADFRPMASQLGVTVSLDNVPNDQSEYRTFNVHADIENMIGTQGPDLLLGSDRAVLGVSSADVPPPTGRFVLTIGDATASATAAVPGGSPMHCAWRPLPARRKRMRILKTSCFTRATSAYSEATFAKTNFKKCGPHICGALRVVFW